MNDAALKSDTQDIVVDEVFPHAPETIWKTLTTGELIGRWMMPPTGFEPVEGKHFTFQTRPAGAWDGVIHCQVLEVVPNERFVYAWKGGHEETSVRLAAGHCRYLDPFQGSDRNARSTCPFRLHHAEERHRVQEHERRLEEGGPEPRRYGGRAGLTQERRHE